MVSGDEAFVVVASRLHWNNHARHEPIDAAKALRQVKTFCTRASTYAGAIVLAIGIPSPIAATVSGSDIFAESVHAFVRQLQSEIDTHSLVQRHAASSAAPVTSIRLVPMTFWGQFVPALNAIISTAATDFPDATRILFQSLEIEVPESGVRHLCTHFLDGTDLVVGAALPGHAFSPETPQPLALDGLTTPWNTLALWDLRQLAKIGFPLVGDGLGLADGVAGVEEVTAIALYQNLYPTRSRATVIQVPGLAWHVQEFADETRRAWQQRKMESKKARPAQQMAHLEIPHGKVYHLEL